MVLKIAQCALALALACALACVPQSAAHPGRRTPKPKFRDNINKLSISSDGPDVQKNFDAVSTGCTGFIIDNKPCAPDNTVNAAIVQDPAGGGDKVMAVDFRAGHYASKSGVQFYTKYSDLGDEGMVEYSVYFSDGFDWVKGGKLPGMHGGNMQCTGSRETPNGHNCFSTRLMWGPGGTVEGYLYLPLQKQEDSFCNRCAWEGGTANTCGKLKGQDFCHFERGAAKFKKGSWQQIRQYIKLNTPGQQNGVFELWLNGRRIMSADNVYYRDNGSMKLSGLLFSTFYGGDTSSYAPDNSERIYFKDIAVYG